MKLIYILSLSILVGISFNTIAKTNDSSHLPCIKEGVFLGSISKSACNTKGGLTVERWTGY
jgi:hypothetical protein